jgi:Tol biopolymer transport system component
MNYFTYSFLFCLLFNASLYGQSAEGGKLNLIHYPEEVHLKNVRQLTFGGENAEAYFSFDDKYITFQATNPKWNAPCDQIFMADWNILNMAESAPRLISTGHGRTTCAFFMPGNQSIIYASTHLESYECPHVPPRRADKKYVWPIYDSFDIFVSDLNGNIIKQLTDTKGYDAEATVSPLGDKIVFTSIRSGDLELYTMDLDGSNVKQITHELGYDGGAFFSPDGKMLVFRASRPKSEEEIKEYKDLLAQNLVAPTAMEIFVCNADGSNLRQVTNLGGANWAPYFTPDGKRIIFSSNHKTKGFRFNLYMINLDGTGLKQITFDDTFDAFPMFSYDGKKLIWSSNRNNNGTRETNLFIADWVE